MESLPLLLSAALMAVIIYVVVRNRSVREAVGLQPNGNSGEPLDPAPQRLHAAMKQYLLVDMKSKDEWLAYSFLQTKLESSRLGRAELVQKLVAEFGIDEREAGKRLTRVLRAVKEVKARARSR